MAVFGPWRQDRWGHTCCWPAQRRVWSAAATFGVRAACGARHWPRYRVFAGSALLHPPPNITPALNLVTEACTDCDCDIDC
ncbi:hypothetical protein HaLaN_08317, partial [Haematococcus lacustris]